MNVYDKSIERINYMFDEFENVYVSLSGGKDSTVCAHLVCEEARKRGRKVGFLHIDIEASYKKTIQHLEYMFDEYKDVIIPIWVCLPMTTDNGLSYYEQLWTWWQDDLKEKWVRKMPSQEYIINLKNNPLDFYKQNMTFEDFIVDFALNYSRLFGVEGKTACVVGIRTQESLNRWRAIHKEKEMYKRKKFTTALTEEVVNFYPIHDWLVEDIWVYNSKFKKRYNEIYDLLYLAGVPITKMRIDEPFGNESKVGLNLFRIIEPDTWAKVVGRVSGANFDNIYNQSSIRKNKYKLPPGHTWKTFTEFLLNTLPEEAKNHYQKKFNKFIKWWLEKGSPMYPEDIKTLEEKYGDKIINTHEYSLRGKGDKEVILFKEVIDEIPEMDSRIDVLSWKRMAMVILKNDYWCKTLSFGLTKQQMEKRKEVMKKYEDIL